MRQILTIIIILIISTKTFGQTFFNVHPKLNADKEQLSFFLPKIDSLFAGIKRKSISNQLITGDSSVVKYSFRYIGRFDTLNKTLINFFPLDKNNFKITFKFTDSTTNDLACIYSMVAQTVNGSTRFTIPLYYETKNWK